MFKVLCQHMIDLVRELRDRFCTRACLHVLYTCMHVHMEPYMHAHYICTYMYTRVRVQVHIHAHTCTRVRTVHDAHNVHTRVSSFKLIEARVQLNIEKVYMYLCTI